ncbi:uncharacterized protein LOC122529991 isoform X1 [Frieseomelitta varia]|uniref:uncharacterized protein LOC122529991 isoform X1 n=1 Tax=Frieseomelitta varia TaxID=561572 RepID=UPI001CB6A309|nr:uncharacterized protein LOC122529991 isoform X1 [Frieseomelitta varia]XP_043512529.1 uncharacterized protein LOC122529991 isoform X1 [Frieseomelitta varia]
MKGFSFREGYVRRAKLSQSSCAKDIVQVDKRKKTVPTAIGDEEDRQKKFSGVTSTSRSLLPPVPDHFPHTLDILCICPPIHGSIAMRSCGCRLRCCDGHAATRERDEAARKERRDRDRMRKASGALRSASVLRSLL